MLRKYYLNWGSLYKPMQSYLFFSVSMCKIRSISIITLATIYDNTPNIG